MGIATTSSTARAVQQKIGTATKATKIATTATRVAIVIAAPDIY